MSDTPQAAGTRQRATRQSTDPDVVNPASLSASRDKKVPRNKPHVKPPFWDMSMNKFLTYMVLGLSAIGAFYFYRFTVWAADAGGYWNLITGNRPSPAAIHAESAMQKAAEVAGQAASSGKAGKGAAGGKDVQSQIYALATALGVKPADLTSATRPLIDPSVANPVEACQKELEMVKLQLAAGAGTGAAGAAALNSKVDEKAAEGSLLGLAAEALLD